jgi:hypothetical protein
MLKSIQGDPDNGAFFSWDNVMSQRGVALAEAGEDGMPTMIKGEVTGAGKLPGAQPPHQPGVTGDAPHEGSGAGAAHMPVGQPSSPPMGKMDANPIPFGAELAAAGFAPASAAGDWIDWGMGGAMGPEESPKGHGGQHHTAPPTTHFSAPATQPGSTPAHQGSTSSSSAMMTAKQGPAYGRGAGETFVYGRDDEDSKDKSPLGKSLAALDALLSPLEPLIKATGHKYKSRKKVGGKWVYDYGESGGGGQMSLFGEPAPTKRPAPGRKAARAGASPTGVDAYGPEAMARKRAAYRDEDAEERAIGKRMLAEARAQRSAQDGAATRAAQAGTAAAEARARQAPTEAAQEAQLPAGARAALEGARAGQSPARAKATAVKDAVLKFQQAGDRGALVAAVREITKMSAPRSLEGKRAHAAELRELSDHLGAQFHAMAKHRDAAPSDAVWKNRDAAARLVQTHQKHVSARYHKIDTAANKQAAKTEKSMDAEITMYDQSGRALRKGLSAFQCCHNDAQLPEIYLYDYLCAFVEEACEHESHVTQQLSTKEQLDTMAMAVMHELVATLPKNENLRRACAMQGCSKDTVARIIVEKGLLPPASDIYGHTDEAGAAAMGAIAEPMAYSQKIPWVQGEVAPRDGASLLERAVEDAGGLVKSDETNPYQALQERRVAEARTHWGVPDLPAEVTASDSCPVHASADMTKSMNLWNPMQPCTCFGGAPNAHG